MKRFLFIFIITLISCSLPYVKQGIAQQDNILGFPALPSIQIAPELPPVESKSENENLPAGMRCFNLINSASYTILGSFYTNYYVSKAGHTTRHQSNFRLKSKEESEFCSYGPFYGEDESRLFIVLKTLIPVFECYVRAEGDIVVKGIRKPEGGTHTWISCP